MPRQKEPLSPKQKRFIESYLTYWNITRAAREAGYKHPEKISTFLMNTKVIRDAITQRLKDLRIDTNEAFARLSEQSRLNPSMFFKFEWIPVVDDEGNPVLDDNKEPLQEYKMVDV